MESLRHRNSALIILFALGCCFSIFLLSFVEEGVFFSGDAGLKSLMVEQYDQGKFAVTLHDTRPSWVERAWDSGLYPFGPPFVYETPEGPVVVFPPMFQVLSAVLHKVAGYRGLYLIPTASLWLLWCVFLLACRDMNFDTKTIALAFAALVFATPLTLYGAMYWEHTLAVTLVFLAVDISRRSIDRSFGIGHSVFFGLLAGLAIWLRPEAAILIIPLLFRLLYLRIRKDGRTNVCFFLVALAVMGLFILGNQVIFGHPLGAHSFQVLAKTSSVHRMEEAIQIGSTLFRELVTKLPLVLVFFVGLMLIPWRKKKQFVRDITLVLLVFFITLPFFVPNSGGKQWGPRYLLIAIPVLLLVCGYQLQRVFDRSFKKGRSDVRQAVRLAFVGGFLVLAGAGFWINTIGGARVLAEDYSARVKPALERVRAFEANPIGVSSQFVAQELAAVHREKHFFRVDDDRNMTIFLRTLADAGEDRFLLVFFRVQRVALPPEVLIPSSEGERYRITFDRDGTYGNFDVWEGRIRPEA